jgi:hypothetical protein
MQSFDPSRFVHSLLYSFDYWHVCLVSSSTEHLFKIEHFDGNQTSLKNYRRHLRPWRLVTFTIIYTIFFIGPRLKWVYHSSQLMDVEASKETSSHINSCWSLLNCNSCRHMMIYIYIHIHIYIYICIHIIHIKHSIQIHLFQIQQNLCVAWPFSKRS